MRKIIKSLAVMCLIIPCAVLFTACSFPDIKLPNINWKFWEKQTQSNNQGDDDFVSVSFALDSWETISKISALIAAGEDNIWYEVGDEKDIELSTEETITVLILGFNHDDLSDGIGKAGISIGMKDLLTSAYNMNTTATNIGGWDESNLRGILNTTIFATLPNELQSVIKAVDKKTSAGNQGNTLLTSEDKLWLYSFQEIFAQAVTVLAGEGAQYEYWKTRETSADRIKYPSGSKTASNWWLRSPSSSSAVNFRGIDNGGYTTNYGAQNTAGVCFGFCV